MRIDCGVLKTYQKHAKLIFMNKTILSSVVGSHLHGLNTETSDLDVVDIKVEPTISTFGIHHLAKRKTSQRFDESTVSPLYMWRDS